MLHIDAYSSFYSRDKHCSQSQMHKTMHRCIRESMIHIRSLIVVSIQGTCTAHNREYTKQCMLWYQRKYEKPTVVSIQRTSTVYNREYTELHAFANISEKTTTYLKGTLSQSSVWYILYNILNHRCWLWSHMYVDTFQSLMYRQCTN